jgi:transposase-like protein
MTNNPIDNQITPPEKIQAIQSVWSHEKTVKETCRELGISKQTYYQWEKKITGGMETSLIPQKKGRKKKDWIAPEKQEKEIQKLRNQIKLLEKKEKKLKRENELTSGDLKIARIIIEHMMPKDEGAKKNAGGDSKPKIN